MPFTLEEQKLWDAAYSGDIDRAKDILDKGADPNTKPEFGWTPLHTAAGMGNIKMLELLLEHGADQNARDVHGLTPLHYAAISGHSKAAELLLDFWADPKAVDSFGSTPLQYATSDAVVRLCSGEDADTGGEDEIKEETQKPMFSIRINENELSQSIEPAADASMTNYILIQTRKPLNTTQRAVLEEANITLYNSICINTYRCRYEGVDLQTIRRMHNVVYVDTYRQEYKIHPNLKKKAARFHNDIDVTMIFHDPTRLDVEKIRGQIVDVAGVQPMDIEFSKHKALATVPGRFLDALTAIDEIREIEEVYEIQLCNNQAQLVMGIDAPQHPSPLAQRQVYEGNGQIIAIADTGIDTGDVNNIHYSFGSRVCAIYPVNGSTEDLNGHGTHICGSAVGNGVTNDSLHIMGTAPKANIVVQSLWDTKRGNIMYRGDLAELFDGPYRDHAVRVHSNSWGERSVNDQLGYTSQVAEIDEFVWDHKDILICWAAGNDSKYDQATTTVLEGQIGGAAAAKNCITVGASENSRPEIPYTYATWPRNNFPAQVRGLRMSEDPSRVATFSNRGPTKKDSKGVQRIKPDVVAPSTFILSARSSLAQNLHLFTDTRWCLMSGTSMATPLVAGCAAVLREALMRKEGSPLPSAALIKALLINGADTISAVTPNIHSGFGRVNLAKSMITALGEHGTGFIEHTIDNSRRSFSTGT